MYVIAFIVNDKQMFMQDSHLSQYLPNFSFKE